MLFFNCIYKLKCITIKASRYRIATRPDIALSGLADLRLLTGKRGRRALFFEEKQS